MLFSNRERGLEERKKSTIEGAYNRAEVEGERTQA